MEQRFEICLIHMSHTDVGYTDTQEKMKAHHIDFIRQALELVRQDPDFVWNCESYWCVRQFLKVADDRERQAFAEAVKEGRIGLSASYLNLTDLVPEYVHREIMAQCVREREALGLKAGSAVTADVNGYSWGFADILLDAGAENLMSCIHTHHGYHPLFQKQTPFWWVSPRGRKLLCWNGEHYNFGNELGIAQASWFEYTLQDGMSLAQGTDFEKAVRRLDAYVRSLKEGGYPYDFVPVSLSGNMTDNSPPSPLVPDFVRRYNALGGPIRLRMVTLDDFFARLRQQSQPIPVYAGDWTDWWADGVGSTPAEVLQYRSAARTFHIMGKLGCGEDPVLAAQYAAAREDLMFYGEHTWGYSSSITEPFHPQVNNLDQWKRLYALKASEAAVIMKEAVQQRLGETAVSLSGELRFRAVNPHDVPFRGMLECDLEHFYGHSHFDVLDGDTLRPLPFQLGRYSRGPKMCIWLDLAPKETKTFLLRELPPSPLPSAGRKAPTGIEGVDDLFWRCREALEQGGCVSIEGIENQYFKIAFTPEEGIRSIVSKQSGRELLDPSRPYGGFTPVYEVTPRDMGEDQLWVRRNMGRNRKAVRTMRSPGRLYDVKVLENGALYSRAELKYAMEGVQACSLIVTAHKLTPRIDLDFRIHKTSVWEPENLYLSLPFAGEEVWLDKSGAVFRPRIDQLPGTCVDFYAVQNGLAFRAGAYSTLITSPDVPLFSFGSLRAHLVRLMGEGPENVDEVYSWVMNNFWETNFKASLGGFYQFRYSLVELEERDPEKIFRSAEALNEGVLQFYLFEKEGEEG